MKKMLTGLFLSGILGLSAQADVVRVEAGVGVWNQEVSGPITNSGVVREADTLGFDTQSEMYAWAYIKHPIPILPNIRFEYANVDFTGTSSVGPVNSTSQVGLSQFDTILYYNILDNTAWVTLDLGLDLKYIDAIFKIDNSTIIPSVDEAESFILPMGYGRARIEIPGTDIGIEGMAKYITYKNTSMLDAQVKVDYTLVDILPIDIGLELGYRIEKLDLDGSDFDLTTSADVKVDGIFFGAVVRF